MAAQERFMLSAHPNASLEFEESFSPLLQTNVVHLGDWPSLRNYSVQ